LIGTPIIPATVLHPLFGFVLSNGVSCEADGLEAQPVGQPFILGADDGGGVMPVIAANTAPGPGPGGSVAWGPRMEYQITNLEPDRLSVVYESRCYPALEAVLDPGALVQVFITLYVAATNAAPGTMVPFYSAVVWEVNNTSPGGPSLQVFSADRTCEQQVISAWVPGTPIGTFAWRGIQTWIRATGFGPGSVAGSDFLGQGPSVVVQAVPL
jgi:hypothetical protein